MSNLPQLEEEMRKNDESIESCTQLYVGMSWSEYLRNVHYGNVLDILNPPIPHGMIDAAVYYQATTENENKLKECMKRIDECTQKLEEIKKAEALLGNISQNPHGNFLRGRNHNNLSLQFEHTLQQAISEQKRINDTLWQYSTQKVVDAHRFQTELSPLLKRKVELTISHKKSIALRMIELRGGAPAAR
jgi:hypothetical protein